MGTAAFTQQSLSRNGIKRHPNAGSRKIRQASLLSTMAVFCVFGCAQAPISKSQQAESEVLPEACKFLDAPVVFQTTVPVTDNAPTDQGVYLMTTILVSDRYESVVQKAKGYLFPRGYEDVSQSKDNDNSLTILKKKVDGPDSGFHSITIGKGNHFEDGHPDPERITTVIYLRFSPSSK